MIGVLLEHLRSEEGRAKPCGVLFDPRDLPGDIPLADFRDSMKFSKYYTSAEWRKLYADGTATKWLQQVTDFFAVAGNIASPVPASTYFDPQLFLQTVKG